MKFQKVMPVPLFDKLALDIKDQISIRRNIRRSPLSTIAQLGWDGQPSLATDLHTQHANIPPLDNLPRPELELKRFA